MKTCLLAITREGGEEKGKGREGKARRGGVSKLSGRMLVGEIAWAAYKQPPVVSWWVSIDEHAICNPGNEVSCVGLAWVWRAIELHSTLSPHFATSKSGRQARGWPHSAPWPDWPTRPGPSRHAWPSLWAHPDQNPPAAKNTLNTNGCVDHRTTKYSGWTGTQTRWRAGMPGTHMIPQRSKPTLETIWPDERKLKVPLIMTTLARLMLSLVENLPTFHNFHTTHIVNKSHIPSTTCSPPPASVTASLPPRPPARLHGRTGEEKRESLVLIKTSQVNIRPGSARAMSSSEPFTM